MTTGQDSLKDSRMDYPEMCEYSYTGPDDDWKPAVPKEKVIFSTINRHPGLFKNYPGIDYNSETTFARVDAGMESAFRWECANKNIEIMIYPSGFKL